MQTIPLAEPLASPDRIDSAAYYITRLTDVWPQQLADHVDDLLTPDMLALLRQWERNGDAETLARSISSALLSPAGYRADPVAGLSRGVSIPECCWRRVWLSG